MENHALISQVHIEERTGTRAVVQEGQQTRDDQ